MSNKQYHMSPVTKKPEACTGNCIYGEQSVIHGASAEEVIRKVEEAEAQEHGGSFAASVSSEDSAELPESSSGSLFESISASGQAYGAIDRKERSKVMLEDLENSIVKMAESGQMHRFMDSMRKNGLSRYSISNRMIASIQIARKLKEETGKSPSIEEFSDPNKFNVAGFNQWKEQGRTVKKGSKAVWILAPVIVKDKEAPESAWETDQKTGERKPPSKVVGYRAQSVFNVTDTEGDPLPENPSLNEHYFSEEVPEGTMDNLKNHVSSLKLDYSEEEIPGTNVETASGTLAYVRPSENKVVVDSRLPAKQKALALAHEIGHVEAGHTKDIDEYRKHRGQMETEAEMTAYLVGREIGVISNEDDGSDAFSASYIAGWASNGEGKLDHKKIQSAMNNASKAFQKIMASFDKDKADKS